MVYDKYKYKKSDFCIVSQPIATLTHRQRRA